MKIQTNNKGPLDIYVGTTYRKGLHQNSPPQLTSTWPMRDGATYLLHLNFFGGFPQGEFDAVELKLTFGFSREWWFLYASMDALGRVIEGIGSRCIII